ncbi:MAG: DUF1538 domain-containing protein [Actinobacteria bacterium]|nr:DUF1538 domain-containing protein [Actinomycetota bacterium]
MATDENIGALLLENLSESGQALGPLVAVIALIFLIFFRDCPKDVLWSMAKGIIIAALGLTIFLMGVRIGFVPYAQEMGFLLATEHSPAFLIAVGFAIGLTAILAEPAVRILAGQVDRFSSGALREKTILYTISLGVAMSVALNMTRIWYGIPLFYIVGPGYLLALILVAFSHPSFVALAFDAGGVATGPMAVTFILSLAIGVASGTGRDPATEGLGLVALVALAPIITMLLLGLVYKPPWRREEHES